MFQERRPFFQEHVLGEASRLKQCWKSLGEQQFVRDNEAHAFAKAAGFELVPLGLHCDAGAFNKNDSLYVLIWNSLVGQGTTKQKRYVITVLKKSSLLADGSTLAAMWKVVAWSLNALATVFFPDVDHNDGDLDAKRAARAGERLAEGLAGITLQMRGDWQWYCQCFGFPQWNCAENMCWICMAGNNNTYPWHDFRKCASWRGTERDHNQYLRDLASQGKLLPAVFLIRGFRLEGVVIDAMRCMDLGITLHIIGNILGEVVCSKRLASTQAASVAVLWESIKAW